MIVLQVHNRPTINCGSSKMEENGRTLAVVLGGKAGEVVKLSHRAWKAEMGIYA